MKKGTITIHTTIDTRDSFMEYAKAQGLNFSTWAMLELKKVIEKGKKV